MPESNLKYIDASTDDAQFLTETAFQSKKIWGYSDEQIYLWKDDLEISEDYILQNKVMKVFDNNIFIGFFALKFERSQPPEIDHLWLQPQFLRKSYGTIIFKYITEYLSEQGFSKITLVAEPNAKGFYEKLGGKIIGKFESKISGRFLEIFEFQIRSSLKK